MKHVDLMTLLETREICHPSTIVDVSFKSPRRLCVKIRGNPWWKEKTQLYREEDIHFIFDGVVDGAFDLDLLDNECDESLEHFRVVNPKDYEWLAEDGFTIYCSSPLPKPLELFAVVNDYLQRQGTQSSASDFLNFGYFGYLEDFKKVTSSDSYLLARLPPALTEIVLIELERQGVNHNKIATKLRSNRALLVHFGNQNFFCDTAVAAFEE